MVLQLMIEIPGFLHADDCTGWVPSPVNNKDGNRIVVSVVVSFLCKISLRFDVSICPTRLSAVSQIYLPDSRPPFTAAGQITAASRTFP